MNGETHSVVERVAHLEAEVAELKALFRSLAPSPYRARCPASYDWLEPPDHLKNVTDYSQMDPEALVYIHELTPGDVRRRLDELEKWYGMSSEEFYQMEQHNEADDIFEKMEWSMLYEAWLETQAEVSQTEKVTV